MKDADEGDRPRARRVAIGLAFSTVVLRDRRLRRNALFGLTLLTLLLVFGGAVFLGDGLMEHPVAFLIFWGLCFLLVGLVLLLAFYDLLAVRREHRERVRALEREMAEKTSSSREGPTESATGESEA